MMKQRVVQIVLIVVILIALGFIVNHLRPKSHQYTYEQVLVDVTANKVFTQKFSLDKAPEFPVESPFSEGRNAYPVYKCMKDGTIFAFAEPKFDEGAPPPNPDAIMPRCPVCGGFEVIVPELPEGQDSMDVPGPVQIVKPGAGN